METGEKKQYPISHWSYSSMLLFLKNPLQFKKQYILNIFDYKNSPAAVVGQACHAALAEYYKNGSSMDKITEVGLAIIDKTPDDKIDFGKTGSREKMIENFTQGLSHYFAELPKIGEIVGVEESITEFIEEMDLPAKCKVDLLYEDNGDLIIRDHKFVSSFSDPDKDKPEFILQAMFNYFDVKAKFKKAPIKIIYDECKISKNKNGEAQRQEYEIIFAKHPDYFNFFKQIYSDCTEEVCRTDRKFLPNIGDLLSGAESFEEYRKKIITVDAPFGISHRTESKKFTDKKYIASTADIVDNQFLTNEEKIRTKFLEFGIAVQMKDTFTGPNITLYTCKPSRGTKMSTIEGYSKDLAIALKTPSIRVQAPIMGTDTIGVEIPNENRTIVNWSLGHTKSETLNIPIGVNVHNEVVYKNLVDMPHLLVAGATGSGKSVMLNVIIHTLVEQNDPSKLKMVLIDPKRVELSQFKYLPHLLSKVIFEEKEAIRTIKWLVEEMEIRYNKLERYGHRSIDEFNNNEAEIMPKIVVVIDEFADLVLSNVKQKKTSKVTETRSRGTKITLKENDQDELTIDKMIVRLAQKARAIGIHLILGMQRPSVDVVSGLIKANFPTRISFMTSSQIDSKVILDQAGAEELIGKGDLLFLDPHTKGIQRLQGLFV